MPKKKPGVTPEELRGRLKAGTPRLVVASELSATEGDNALDSFIRTDGARTLVDSNPPDNPLIYNMLLRLVCRSGVFSQHVG